jgi:hypothetical protein
MLKQKLVKNIFFWDVTPCSQKFADVTEETTTSIILVEVQAEQSINQSSLLHSFFLTFSLVYSPTLKMEAVCSFKTAVNLC